MAVTVAAAAVAAVVAVVAARTIVRLESGALIPPEISRNIGSVWVCLCMRGRGAAAEAEAAAGRELASC